MNEYRHLEIGLEPDAWAYVDQRAREMAEEDRDEGNEVLGHDQYVEAVLATCVALFLDRRTKGRVGQ